MAKPILALILLQRRNQGDLPREDLRFFCNGGEGKEQFRSLDIAGMLEERDRRWTRQELVNNILIKQY